MPDAKSFTEDLETIKTSVANDDIDWVKFVHDHYQLIFDSSEEIILDKEDHYWKHYRLEDFLQERKMDPNLAWIVLLINQLPSNAEFTGLETLRLPDPRTVEAIRKIFLQYRASVKGCRR